MRRWCAAGVVLIPVVGVLAWLFLPGFAPMIQEKVAGKERSAPAEDVAASPSPPLPPPKAETDPLLRRWHAAVSQRNKDEVVSVQAALQAREGEYREGLERMAREDLDARVRAFTVTLLGRFKAGPGEAFFVERLGDTSEFPRDAALGVLERLGTRASLRAVERVAAGDPAEPLRVRASAVAKTLRAK